MDDSTTQKLVERDVTTWQALIHDVVRDDAFEPNGALAQRLLEQRDEISEWVAFAHETIEEDDRLFTKSTPRRRFEAWFIRSSLEVLPAGDEELFDLRFRLLTIDPTFDGGLAQAIALLEDLAASPQPVDPEFIAEVCLLAVKGAFTHHDWAKAATYAQMASRGFRASQNEDRYRFSQRRLGAAKIGVGELQAGFEIFDEALTAPGPLFGGGGVTIFSPAETERDEAVHEMEATSAWATLWTPEYVRAIGGLAERWDDGAQRAWLWDRFASALGAMFDASGDVESDIEVVVRHAGDRGQYDVVRRALALYVERFPDDTWGTRQQALVSDHVRFDELSESWGDDPGSAIETLTQLFDRYEADGSLGESEISFRVTELLLDVLIDQHDRRAIDVQTRLLNQKLDQWGECPAAWLERQNLGTIYAAFGENDAARSAYEHALQHLIAQFGDDHPHVEMAQRNIARLEE